MRNISGITRHTNCIATHLHLPFISMLCVLLWKTNTLSLLPYHLGSPLDPKCSQKCFLFFLFCQTMALMLQPCLLMFRRISFFELSAGAGNQLPPPALILSNLGHSPCQNFSSSTKDCLFKILSLVWTICRQTFLSHQLLGVVSAP